MKNYIKINGQKIELTDEQVKEMQESFGLESVRLGDKKVGETFKIGKHEFIVLEHSKETTSVILKDLLHISEKFGTNNNYKGSHVEGLCNAFEVEIAVLIGKDNLIEHTVDLTADDGLKDYGKVKCKMSLLTANLYRRYVETLDMYKTGKWWWLATAFSTPKHDDSTWVKCVSPSGCIYYFNCYCSCGVRPVLHFASSISVSCED